MAASTTSAAPHPSAKPPRFPSAITTAPENPMQIPIQPNTRSLSPRKIVAASAVQIGTVWMSSAAGPAAMVCSPMFSAML